MDNPFLKKAIEITQEHIEKFGLDMINELDELDSMIAKVLEEYYNKGCDNQVQENYSYTK